MANCNLVGDFHELDIVDNQCIISVSNSINSDLNDYGCASLGEGPCVGTLTLTAYASNVVYYGDPGRAGCQVIWTRKYDCVTDKLYFIFVRPGRSFSYGGAGGFATITNTSAASSKVLSASAQSGPTGLYHSYTQKEGVGLSYSGSPLSFDSNYENSSTFSNMGIGSGAYYLRNFSLDVIPGTFPVASYTFDYKG